MINITGQVKVWRAHSGNYIVSIKGDIYEMSANAHLPESKGVCIYLAKRFECHDSWFTQDLRVNDDVIPEGIRVQAAFILSEQKNKY